MKICVLPGDGIGPEITAEAVRVLKSLDLKFEMEEALLGGAAVDATGCSERSVARSGTACPANSVRSAACLVSARISTCLRTCGRRSCTRSWPTHRRLSRKWSQVSIS